MAIEVRVADSEGERAAIFRHRYEVCCEELRRFRDGADHGRRLLVEPVDGASRQVAAFLDGAVIGSMRWTWGGDAAFAESHVAAYRLEEFLGGAPAKQVVIGERLVVSADHRHRDVAQAMFASFMAFVNEHRVQLVIGACEPELLDLYAGLGFRPYSMENIDSAEAGYLIPLVLVAEDVGYLREIRSPLAGALRDFGRRARVPAAVLDLVRGPSAVRSERASSDDDYWLEIQTAFALGGMRGLHLFEGLSAAEIREVVRESNLIECRAGDHVVRKREVARNMYVVLDGALEARDGDRYLATLMRGDVIGEIGFLLATSRTADVIAMMDGTRLLSLSETTLRGLIEAEPALAARLMLNLSRLLCAKLAFKAM